MSIHQHMERFNQRLPYRLTPEAATLLEELYREARATYKERLSRHCAELSDLFTRARAAIGDRYLEEPSLSAAYKAYFLPVNFAKVQLLLDELPDARSPQMPFSVLDVGAGMGTASLAVADWMRRRSAPQAHLSVTALDHSDAALGEARRLWVRFGELTGAQPQHLTTSVQRLEQWTSKRDRPSFDGAPFDVIVVANCLNELFCDASDPAEPRSLLVEHLLAMLKPAGALIVLEPALRSTARALHRTRDLLLSRGACTIYSPCLHDRPCPALVKREDWCHEERAWDAPAWIAALDRELGFIKDALKFAYLILRKDGRTIVPRRLDVYRVVSELRVLKGEKRAWLCNEQGRSEVGRLDRKTTSTNAAMEAWQRGDIVEIDHIVRKQREGKSAELGRIAEEGTVTVIRQA